MAETNVRVCVLQTDGTNCDEETKHAFELAGAQAEKVHIKSLIKGYDPVTEKSKALSSYDILAIPGGFSYGDDVASGRILAEDLRHFLRGDIQSFVKSGKPVIGICNGFQALVKYGLLPEPKFPDCMQEDFSLTYNTSGKFECRWVELTSPANKCIWTKGIRTLDLSVAHGEGNFVEKRGYVGPGRFSLGRWFQRKPGRLVNRLFDEGQVVFQYSLNGKPTMLYPDNPNGSMSSVAGICDPTGTVLGLMPHPERYWKPENHATATLQKVSGTLPREGLGLQIFRNGVEYAQERKYLW